MQAIRMFDQKGRPLTPNQITHRAKMALKRGTRRDRPSDYPRPEMKVRTVKIGGVDVPQMYTTGRILGPGGYVATKNDDPVYRKQVPPPAKPKRPRARKAAK